MDDNTFKLLCEKLEDSPDFCFRKTEYQKLALALGTHERLVEALRKDLVSGSKSYAQIIFELIHIWMRDNGDRATLERLYRRFKSCGWLPIRNFLEENLVIDASGQDDPLEPTDAEYMDSKTYGSITYFPNKILGHGSFGTVVYKGKWNQRNVAVKEIIYRSNEDMVVASEVNALLDSDDHDNVVRYFEHTEVNGDVLQVFLALQLCDATLSEWVKNNSILAPATIEPVEIIHDITKGLAHLHDKGIIHRDIKPQNILMLRVNKFKIQVKISDFGISRRISNDATSVTLKTYSGTVGWKAPEVLVCETGESTSAHGSFKAYMSRETDIFSLGCVSYYILTNGCHPFGENPILSQANVLQYQLKVDLDKLKAQHLGYIRLILMMISKEPKRRPSASSILHHHIFWSKKTNLQFLIDVSNATEKLNNGTELQLGADGLGKCSVMSICTQCKHGGWNYRLCPELQAYASGGKGRKGYDGTSMISLLRLIRNLQSHYSTQSQDIIAILGRLPDQFLDYWLARFPFLVDSVWMNFEVAKADPTNGLQNYYSNGFNFGRIDIARDVEKILVKYEKRKW